MNLSGRDIYRDASNLLQGGRPEDAVDLISAWLEQNPDDELGLSILGSAMMKLERMNDALAAFGRAVAAHPGSFAAHGDLGFGHMAAGNPDDATAAFQKAVALNPRFYQGWCYLGRLQVGAGAMREAQESFAQADANDPFLRQCRDIQAALDGSRLAAAEKLARKILSQQRGHPKASLALAHLATTVGAFEEAADILAAGIENFPLDVALRQALISSLEEIGNYRQALEQAKTIADIHPRGHAGWQTLGRVHGHCGNYEEALAAYDRALTLIAADDPLARGSLQLLRGHVLKILGRHGQSVQAYRASAESVNGNGAAWWGLADLKTHVFSAADIREMQRLSADQSIRPAQRSQAGFALGKALEDRGDYGKAFRAYETANATRPDTTFNAASFDRSIDELIEQFTPDVIAKRADPLPHGPTPIYIVGLPRSGSTLIEQILASHSAIEGTMELVNLPNLLRRIRIDGGKRNLAYPRSMAGFTAMELSAYGQKYLDDTAMYRSGSGYFIDKMPTNFDKVALIRMILPRAVIIDARRHPMDCGFSCFKQHFAGGHDFSYRLEDIATYYKGYLRLMDHWDRIMPGAVLCVHYERLVARTEEVVRTILAHCGVPFEEECLSFFRNRRPVRTASSEQVRQPIYSKGVNHWRNFAQHLQPLSEALGPATLARFE